MNYRRAIGVCVCHSAAALFASQAVGELPFKQIGRYETGVFDDGAAEIVAYDAATRQLFVTNAGAGTVDILDITTPSLPTFVTAINAPGVNSVASFGGVIAVAQTNTTPTDPGIVSFFDATGSLLNTVSVGATPDMLTFTPDGQRVLVANEGEPNEDYTIDPVGSVSIIDLSGGVGSASVKTAGFGGVPIGPNVRVFGPGASPEQDLEPEFIAVSPDGQTAFVTLQENNALGVLDLNAQQFTEVLSLGFKDHRLPTFGIDPSDRDGGVNIQNAPVLGMFQPDGIAAYEALGETFYVTANEGDARDYEGFTEDERVADLSLDPTRFPDAATLQLEANLGRLSVSAVSTESDPDGDGLVEALFSFGGRSFSIWDAEGNRVFDSGDDFEVRTAITAGVAFNANNDENASFDARSDNKGPEPEAVAIGEVDGRTYAFIGLERVGGIMIYDITNPFSPDFVRYENNRDFGLTEAELEAGLAGDLGPEGLLFVEAVNSPIGVPLLVVANEISGTTTIYAMPEPTTLALLAVAGLAWTRRRPRRAGSIRRVS